MFGSILKHLKLTVLVYLIQVELFDSSGTEVVVLGWDPTDTHTDNFWEELGSATDLASGTT